MALSAGVNASLPDSVWWVWEGSVGYVLLDRLPAQRAQAVRAPRAPPLPTLHVSATVANGTWAKLGVWTDWTACNLFALWLEHAQPVSGAAAAYAIAPGVALQDWAGASGMAQALAASLTLVANTAPLQAVSHGGDGVLAVVAYAPTAQPMPAGAYSVAVSAPGAYLLRWAGGSAAPALAAAQPAQIPWAANVSLVGAGLAPAPGAPNCSAVPGGLAFHLTAPPADGSSVLLEC